MDKPRYHGYDHREGGPDPIPGLSPGGAADIYPSAFQPVPLLAIYDAQLSDVGGHWAPLVDTASLNNAVFTNSRNALGGSARTPLITDYFTLPVTLGPTGSIWALFGNWKLQTNGGKFKITLGSVVETAGALAVASGVTYHAPGSGTYFDDTYQGIVTYDGGSSIFSSVFKLGGAVGDPFTAVTGTDPTTGVSIIDGGSGQYRWKLGITGKNSSSSGYRIDLMNMAWVRLDDYPGI